MTGGYILGLIVGGVIAWLIFVFLIRPVLDWIMYKWFGWEYIDSHGVYHRQRGDRR